MSEPRVHTSTAKVGCGKASGPTFRAPARPRPPFRPTAQHSLSPTNIWPRNVQSALEGGFDEFSALRGYRDSVRFSGVRGALESHLSSSRGKDGEVVAGDGHGCQVQASVDFAHICHSGRADRGRPRVSEADADAAD